MICLMGIWRYTWMEFKKNVHYVRKNKLVNCKISSKQECIEEKDITMEEKAYSDSELKKDGVNRTEDIMAQDLMRLVGSAIEEWAKIYEMDKLPKKIVFQQALTILNAMNKLFYGVPRKGDKMTGWHY